MKRFLPSSPKNPFSWALLVLFLLTSPLAAAKRVLDRSIVTVNEDVILQSDIDKFQKKIQSKSYQQLFGVTDESVAKDPKKVLQLLIEEKIINQQVKRLELSASEEEIEGQIRAVLKRNAITEAQLTDRIKQLGSTMAEYRDGIKRQIERKNLVEREIKPTLESSASDEELRHYYNQNMAGKDTELQYKIAHLFIGNNDKKGGGLSAEQRANTIYKDLSEHPENFDAAVKDYSDDSGTSTAGGLLGYFPLSQLAKEFRAVVPKTQVGKVTAPIKTKSGYHIIKLLETRSGADFATLTKEKKEELRNEMMGQEYEKRMAMWLERKKNEAYIRVSDAKDSKEVSNALK
jgi:peptidyl-prolyl cis-trans isomerase SurA